MTFVSHDVDEMFAEVPVFQETSPTLLKFYLRL